MFGISGFELVIIAAFALIIFGPDKIPEMARTAGRIMRAVQARPGRDGSHGACRDVRGAQAQKAAETVGHRRQPRTSLAEMDDDDDEEEEEEE